MKRLPMLWRLAAGSLLFSGALLAANARVYNISTCPEGTTLGTIPAAGSGWRLTSTPVPSSPEVSGYCGHRNTAWAVPPAGGKWLSTYNPILRDYYPDAVGNYVYRIDLTQFLSAWEPAIVKLTAAAADDRFTWSFSDVTCSGDCAVSRAGFAAYAGPYTANLVWTGRGTPTMQVTVHNDFVGPHGLLLVGSLEIPCKFTPSRTEISFTPQGGSEVVTVTANAQSCRWIINPAPLYSWLSYGPISATGTATMTFSASANAGSDRTFSVTGKETTDSDNKFTIQGVQYGCTATVTTTPSPPNFPSTGGAGTITVVVNSGCAWNTGNVPSWISVTGGSGTGNKTFQFTVAANTGAARQATLTVAGRSVLISQDPAPCTLTLSPFAVTLSFSHAWTSTFAVTSPGHCSGLPINATSNAAAWLSVSGITRTGSNATVSYSVAQNTGPQRTGTITVSNGSSSATFTVTQPPGGDCIYTLTPTSQQFTAAEGTRTFAVTATAGCSWQATTTDSWITIAGGSPGTGPGIVSFWVAANHGSTRVGTIQVAGQPFTITQDGDIVSGYQFTPLTPCRVVDTRVGYGKSGLFGPPFLAANQTRDFPVPASGCGAPPSAKAYSLNFTVVPKIALGYLTTWPTGNAQPFVSTLNSFHGGVVSNAAIVPAGTGGAISVFVTDTTELIVDINGYFDDVAATNAFDFYPLAPCRIVDTRPDQGFAGMFGQPMMNPAGPGGISRDFPLLSSTKCIIPTGARAYSLNATVVPAGPLYYLTLYPAGGTVPVVSTLNAFEGQVNANAAIVPGGSGSAIAGYVTNPTHLILDVNGYFAPPSMGGLKFKTVVPCRVADTRPSNPVLGGTWRDFQVSGTCGVPTTAQAFSLNVTVVPMGTLSYLTLWPTGQPQPIVSTLNSFVGRVLANAALVPAGADGMVRIFVTDTSHVILDINGYFAP